MLKISRNNCLEADVDEESSSRRKKLKKKRKKIISIHKHYEKKVVNNKLLIIKRTFQSFLVEHKKKSKVDKSITELESIFKILRIF